MKLYFDWNAMAQFRHPLNPELVELEKLISECRREITVPFSPAHMQDLRKQSTLDISDYITKDLKFISDFTEGKLIQILENSDQVEIVDCSAENAYKKPDWINAPLQNPISDLTDLIHEFQETHQVDIKSQDAFTKLLMMKFDNLPEEWPLPKEMEAMKGILPKKGQTGIEWLGEAVKWINEFMNDPEKYKDMRNSFQSLYGLIGASLSNSHDAFKDVEEILKANNNQRMLHEFLYDDEPEQKPDSFYFFVKHYGAMDLLGFRPEKLTKKNTFKNIAVDAQHSFYGSRCDFFVTNDAKCLAKSQQVYNRLQIQTKVCTLSELYSELRKA